MFNITLPSLKDSVHALAVPLGYQYKNQLSQYIIKEVTVTEIPDEQSRETAFRTDSHTHAPHVHHTH